MDQWVREQYKSKGGFGMKTLETRRSATAVNRQEQRNTLLKKLRNIPETMSPLMSPMVPKTKELKEEKVNVSKLKQATADGKSKRLMMLKKWKEEKERKKLEEKKKAKPAFKVFHVEHKENLQDIYKSIKGKPINSKVNTATPLVSTKASVNAPRTLRTFNSKGGKSQINEILNNQKAKVSKDNFKDTKAGQKLQENSERSGKEKSKSEKQLKISKSKSVVKLDFKELENQNETEDKKLQNSSTPKKQSKSKSPAKIINNEITTDRNERKSKRKSRRKIEKDSIAEETAASENRYEPQLISDEQNDMDNLLEGDKESTLEENNEQKTPRRSRRMIRIFDEENMENSLSKTSNKKAKRDKTPSQSSSKDSKTSVEHTPVSVEKNFEDAVLDTAKKSSEEEICYVSPFVTVSRGKKAARKEFEQRSLNSSIYNTSITGTTDPRSPKAAADYFTRVLNKEISRIQDLCKIWQNYKDEDNVSEDACGLIDMTIGQSNLLITKKFNQFRGLIERCKSSDELDRKVQCEDLHGFWDMIYKQVRDLDKRFENLEDMKKNNWLEEVPKVKTPKVAAVKTRKKRRGKNTKASSGLKETILAARKGRMNQVQSEGDVEILIIGKKGTPRRQSRNVKEVGTPGRGILKSGNGKSEKRKTVVFHNLIENDEKANLSPRVFKGTPIPSRRSERISLNRSKLVFEE